MLTGPSRRHRDNDHASTRVSVQMRRPECPGALSGVAVRGDVSWGESGTKSLSGVSLCIVTEMLLMW